MAMLLREEMGCLRMEMDDIGQVKVDENER